MVDGLATRQSPKWLSVLNSFLANGTLANDSLRFVDWPSTIDYPVTLIAPTEELEELTVEESSSDEDDFDAMEVEPMLTHINKRARFE